MTRLLALGLVLTLTVASCEDQAADLESDDRDASGDTMMIVPDDGDSDAGAPRGGGAESDDDADEGGSRPGGGSGDGGGAGGGDAGGGDAGGGGGAAGFVVDDQGRVGSMGRALLSRDVPEAVVEIDTSPGRSLTNQARSALVRRLEDHGEKSNVGFAGGSEVPAQDVWTTSGLRSAMQSHRSSWSSGERSSVYVMVLSGRHENENVVGLAFNASSFAIFPDQLAGGLLGLNYAGYEEAVVVHELGHLFGLVNLTGQGAFHEDAEHPGHSSSSGSVMYWAVESTLVLEIFEGGPPRAFDAADVQEMDAIRG